MVSLNLLCDNKGKREREEKLGGGDLSRLVTLLLRLSAVLFALGLGGLTMSVNPGAGCGSTKAIVDYAAI